MDNYNVASNDGESEDAQYFQNKDIFGQIFQIAQDWIERSIGVTCQGDWLKYTNISLLYKLILSAFVLCIIL